VVGLGKEDTGRHGKNRGSYLMEISIIYAHFHLQQYQGIPPLSSYRGVCWANFLYLNGGARKNLGTTV
jgi:hypothetical protein